MLGNPGLTKNETNIKLPISFILFGLVAFVTAQFILFMNSESLTNGIFRTPELLMGAHFLLLGWIVMVIMGAMYQLVPVAFLTPIWSEKLGFVQLIVTGTGIVVFAFLLGYDISRAVYGAGIAIIGIFLFLWQMFMTLKGQKKKTTIRWFVTGALFCFLITILAGFILAWTLAFGASINYSAVLYSHISMGVAGWFSLLIFGFSYKLVPMFSLSHGFSQKWEKPAFVCYVVGLILLITSFWTDISIIQNFGWLLLWLGFTFFGLDIMEILDKRIKKKLDRPFLFSLIAIGYGWLIHTIAVLLRLFGVDNPSIWGWLVFSYIICWVMFSILGYLYKIVPFLWWTHKYATKVGKANVPLLRDMLDESLGIVLFVSFTVGTFGLIMSGLLQLNIAVPVFQGGILLASVYYVYSIVRVLLK